ncbi:hypothetical protein [Undibacterium sp. Ji22W]|uniref:hypothetical protein n=1 Tax=Undibacterium sp. Ji22W TaxID=3413038 RepID=UPI003BF1BD77
MKRLLTTFCCCVLLMLSACEKELQVRFDNLHFFQNEEQLQAMKIDQDQLAQYTRNLQARVGKIMKKAQAAPGNGYIVVAIRSDEEVAVWLDMEPVLHEYYEYEIIESIKKMRPLAVDHGILVFAIKMAVDTAVHTSKVIPEPKAWIEAKKKVGDPDDVEQVVLSVWPEE